MFWVIWDLKFEELRFPALLCRTLPIIGITLDELRVTDAVALHVGEGLFLKLPHYFRGLDAEHAAENEEVLAALLVDVDPFLAAFESETLVVQFGTVRCAELGLLAVKYASKAKETCDFVVVY